MAALPNHFPPLPEPPVPTVWPPNIQNAHRQLSDAYGHAAELVLQDDSDPLRLKYHLEKLQNSSVLILVEMERDILNREFNMNLGPDWFEAAASALGLLIARLRDTITAVTGRESSNISSISAVVVEHTGRRGRPRKVIDRTLLAEAMSNMRNISISKLSQAMCLHRHTIRRYLRLYGLEHKFADLSNEELDFVVRAYKMRKPNSGIRYLRGFLQSQGFRMQRSRLFASLHRVDGLGHALRQHRAINRRKYKSSRPNALWHCDGHHKLIHWGIVIHGFIDGFCRTITGLHASNNNRATTVLDVFLEAVDEYEAPSRVRGDRGGENIEVAVWMILRRGANRASFMWGSSTHNTRIERLWVEVGRHFCREWRAFFTRLERRHLLDRENEQHLWLIHRLFLEDINMDCHSFQAEWNAHPISGPDTNDRSPNDLRLLGQLNHGVYTDDGIDLHPDVLHEHYGTTNQQVRRRRGQTGAGHPPEEDDNSDASNSDSETDSDLGIMTQVAATQHSNIRHAAIPVPSNSNPFESEDSEALYFDALDLIRLEGTIPAGFGALPIEHAYEAEEVIRLGRRGRKELVVGLPEHIWRPRIELWAQAVHLLNEFMYGDGV